MELADLYRKSAFLPKRDAKLCLQEFTTKKRWRENARILDIGCGDGSTSKEILLKYAPPSCKKIVGSDISEKMIDYAKENFGGEQMEFLQWDVSGLMPVHLRGAFDHVFSFYALHWVKQQKVAFLNIYNTLAEGGDCVLMFLGRYTVYEVFRALSRTQKWAEELKDVEVFISPYYDSQDSEKEVSNLMQSVGFKDVHVEVLEKTHMYDDEYTFKNLVKAVNPFQVLNKNWDEFMKDYFEVTRIGPQVKYQLIVAYGTK